MTIQHDYSEPRAYDLTRRSELLRLMRECQGYLHTCRLQHHGTDFKGRQFAIDALKQICDGDVSIALPADEETSG